MATFDYARAVETADRLITKFGQEGAIKRSIPGAGPKHNPGEPTYEYYRVKCAILDFDRREIDGTNILSTDQKVYVSAKNLAIELLPSSDMIVTAGTWVGETYVGGKARTIVPPVRQLNPAGTNVYWKLQVRL